MPALADTLGFISTGYRFQGSTANPCALDFLVIIAFAYLYSFLTAALFQKEKQNGLGITAARKSGSQRPSGT